MKRIDMQAHKRDAVGKGPARSARRAGRIPAVVYGGALAPQPISVDSLLMRKAMQSSGGTENILVNLAFEGEAEPVLTLVRDSQHNPLSGQVEHLDFLRVSLDRAITTTVPIHMVGTAEGTKAGGIFEQVLREVEVECLPLNIPDAIEVDVSALQLGQSLHVSDLPLSETYRILTAVDRSIATVSVPQAEVAPRQAQAAEGAPAEAAPTA